MRLVFQYGNRNAPAQRRSRLPQPKSKHAYVRYHQEQVQHGHLPLRGRTQGKPRRDRQGRDVRCHPVQAHRPCPPSVCPEQGHPCTSREAQGSCQVQGQDQGIGQDPPTKKPDPEMGRVFFCTGSEKNRLICKSKCKNRPPL